MVRATDIEGLLRKYIDGGSLDKADALYLLATLGRGGALDTLRIRYRAVRSLNMVLEDLRGLGVEDVRRGVKVEDTGEEVGNVIVRVFKSICLPKILESAKAKAKKLSRMAREIIYLISVARSNKVVINGTRDVQRFYSMVFNRRADRHEIDRALRELVGCYVVQDARYGVFRLPDYVDDVLAAMKEFIPKVEVKVSWPEGA
ncbi:MAG: hypothetical protein N3F04_04490 [Candidatus Nezhaarchaeota archaeon]|nr:hypothetical protein [Candidatus Nezhaarchaeota archaeon]MCX8142014.1 hypothetical protein [Candidatus Nezhaarchaeota archaeon]MDW8050205.1 hypothetical protein [Nitrososphaerota archaeon]